MSLMDRVLNDMAWVGSVRGRSVWRNCTKMHRIYLSGEVSSHRNCLELIWEISDADPMLFHMYGASLHLRHFL